MFGSPDHVDAHVPLNQYSFRDLATDQVVPMEGFVIRRKVFDAFLFGEAKAVANACYEGFTVNELLTEDGCVVGVSGTLSGETRDIRGRMGIGV